MANQIRFTDSSGNMIILENNLTTGGTSLQAINSLGQRIYQNSLVPLLTINKTTSTVPLLVGDGVNKISQAPSKLPYNPVLKLPVKNPKLIEYKPEFLTEPKQGGTLVIGAGNNPIKGAYNIDTIENIKIGVFKGTATNLVNIPSNSQVKVVIQNPDGFDPLNPEILRVVKEGGEIEITGIKSNKKFYDIYSGKVEIPEGFELIEAREIPENLRKQGYRTDGIPIGQPKTGVGVPKKTDKIIKLKKIKE